MSLEAHGRAGSTRCEWGSRQARLSKMLSWARSFFLLSPAFCFALMTRPAAADESLERRNDDGLAAHPRAPDQGGPSPPLASTKNLFGQTPPARGSPYPYPPYPYPYPYPPYPPPVPYVGTYPYPYYPYGPYAPSPYPGPYPPYPPPPAPPPAPPAKPKSDTPPDWVPRAKDGMFAAIAQIGLRGMVQSTSGADRDVPIGGAGLGAWFFAAFGANHLAGRMDFREHIGGSGAGLDGQYAGDLAAGLRLPLGSFALLVRAGTGGEILGNGKLLWWTYRLPEADAGFHVGDGSFFAEATGIAGVTLGGNFLVGDEGARKIGTAGHAGARATLGLQPFIATASWRRIFESQSGPATPLDALDGATCAVIGHFVGFTICAEGRVLRGAAGFPGGRVADGTVYYAGLTLGVGALLTGGERSE